MNFHLKQYHSQRMMKINAWSTLPDVVTSFLHISIVEDIYCTCTLNLGELINQCLFFFIISDPKLTCMVMFTTRTASRFIRTLFSRMLPWIFTRKQMYWITTIFPKRMHQKIIQNCQIIFLIRLDPEHQYKCCQSKISRYQGLDWIVSAGRVFSVIVGYFWYYGV